MSSGKVKAWYQASRPPFFIATILPLVYAGVLAANQGMWSASKWFVVLLASFFVHLSTNLANDYFDHFAGVDGGESIGGSRVIQQGKITPHELVWAMVLLYGLALLCGLWLLWQTGLMILIPIMLFSFFSSLFYTAPPIRYGYRGLGELFVGINMGPVMVGGTYAVLTGRLEPSILIHSLPFGLMVALILFYQSLPDIEVDKAANKLTIAARISRRSSIWLYRAFILMVLSSIAYLYLNGLLHSVVLLALATILLALRIDRMLRSTENWVDLHENGKWVRLFYMSNGLILIISASLI